MQFIALFILLFQPKTWKKTTGKLVWLQSNLFQFSLITWIYDSQVPISNKQIYLVSYKIPYSLI